MELPLELFPGSASAPLVQSQSRRFVAVVGPVRARSAVLRRLGALGSSHRWAPPILVVPLLGKVTASEEPELLVVAAGDLRAVAAVVSADAARRPGQTTNSGTEALRTIICACEVRDGRPVVGALRRPELSLRRQPEKGECKTSCHVDLMPDPGLVLVAVVQSDSDAACTRASTSSIDSQTASVAVTAAGLQVAVRRAAYELLEGCAVVLMHEYDSTDTRESGAKIDRALRALAVDSRKLDQNVGGGDAEFGELSTFWAPAGWDSMDKIQAVVHAVGISEPPQFDILEEPDRGLFAFYDEVDTPRKERWFLDNCSVVRNGQDSSMSRCDPIMAQDGVSAHSKMDVDVRGQSAGAGLNMDDLEYEDEDSFLDEITKLLGERAMQAGEHTEKAQTPETSPRKPRRSSSVADGRKSSRAALISPRSSKTLPRGPTVPGSGAQFFQNMLSVNK